MHERRETDRAILPSGEDHDLDLTCFKAGTIRVVEWMISQCKWMWSDDCRHCAGAVPLLSILAITSGLSLDKGHTAKLWWAEHAARRQGVSNSSFPLDFPTISIVHFRQ